MGYDAICIDYRLWLWIYVAKHRLNSGLNVRLIHRMGPPSDVNVGL